MATNTLLTLEDFDRLPDEEGVVYELDEGELIIMPPPAIIHNVNLQNFVFLCVTE